MDLILDAIHLPPCDDIYVARKMVRQAVKRDRRVKAHIDEVIKLATGIVYKDSEEDKVEESQLNPIEAIRSSFVI